MYMSSLSNGNSTASSSSSSSFDDSSWKLSSSVATLPSAVHAAAGNERNENLRRLFARKRVINTRNAENRSLPHEESNWHNANDGGQLDANCKETAKPCANVVAGTRQPTAINRHTDSCAHRMLNDNNSTSTSTTSTTSRDDDDDFDDNETDMNVMNGKYHDGRNVKSTNRNTAEYCGAGCLSNVTRPYEDSAVTETRASNMVMIGKCNHAAKKNASQTLFGTQTSYEATNDDKSNVSSVREQWSERAQLMKIRLEGRRHDELTNGYHHMANHHEICLAMEDKARGHSLEYNMRNHEQQQQVAPTNLNTLLLHRDEISWNNENNGFFVNSTLIPSCHTATQAQNTR